MSANFNDESFDPREYLKVTLQGSSFESETNRLAEAVAAVDKKLHREVAENFPKLREQVETVQDLDRKVEVIQASTSQLQQSVARSRLLLTTPYTQVQNKVQELQNIWGTTEILRRLGKFLSLMNKVREHQRTLSKASEQGKASTASLDLPKEAKSLRDLEVLLTEQEGSLRGIDIVDKEAEWLKKSSESVRVRAHEMLKHGLATANQAEIRTAVQAFYNTGSLVRVVNKLVADSSQELRKLVAKELDAQGIAAAVAEGSGDKHARGVLLERVERALNAMLAHVVRLAQLTKVLQKTRDPVNQTLLLSLLDHGEAGFFIEEVWRPISSIDDRIARLSKRFAVLSADFPKVHALFEQFVQNVTEHFPASSTSANTASTSGSQEITRWKDHCLQELQAKYLRDVMQRARDKAGAIMSAAKAHQPRDAASGGAPITPHLSPKARGAAQQVASVVLGAQVDTRPFTSTVAHELTTVQGVPVVQQLVCDSINTVVKELLAQTQSDKVTGRSALVVASIATNSQLFNSVLATILLRINSEITQTLNRVAYTQGTEETSGRDRLYETLKACEDEGHSALHALLAPAEAHLEVAVTELLETDNRSERQGYNRSLTVLGERWEHLERNILILYAHIPGDGYKRGLKDVAQRVSNTALRLLSLVRPFTEQSKVGLIHDVTQLQLVLGNIVAAEQLPKAFKEMRAYRTELSLDVQQLNAALVVAGRPDSAALELKSLSLLLLLHCIFQRVESLPPLPSLMKLEPLDYVKQATSQSFCQDLYARAWNALKEWGENGVSAEDPNHILLWESAQEWHKRRMHEAEH